MEEMVPTRKILSFVRKLEEMMNQFEGKEREVFRDIIICMRREFNLGYRKDGMYLLPKRIINSRLVLEDNLGRDYILVNNQLYMYGKLNKMKKAPLKVEASEPVIPKELFKRVRKPFPQS